MKINKGHLFFIETNSGSNIFEVIECKGTNVLIQDTNHIYEISITTLISYEFLGMGIVYLGEL